MAEYNKVMTQIKPDLPKVIDTEQIYVYVPKASYDQAGIMKPDKTQFVIAGDYTLTIKHFTMTDDRVSVDVKMGYDNDTALADLADKDFVSKSNMTGYAVKKLENNTATDKAYIEGANGTGTKLVDVSDGADGESIVKRDAQGRIFGKTTGSAGDNELVNIGYLDSGYVKKSGVANRVYTTDNTGADSVAQFSNNAIPDTMAYRAHDGSLRGAVVTPLDTTLLNNKYVSEHYIPVGDDGKVPPGYLPDGFDDVLYGYYNESTGKFYEEYDSVNGFSKEIIGVEGKLYADKISYGTYIYVSSGSSDAKDLLSKYSEQIPAGIGLGGDSDPISGWSRGLCAVDGDVLRCFGGVYIAQGDIAIGDITRQMYYYQFSLDTKLDAISYQTTTTEFAMRNNAAKCVAGNKLLAFGGLSQSTGVPVNSVGMGIITNGHSTLSSSGVTLPHKMYGGGAAYVNGKVYLFGGIDENDTYYDTIYEYDLDAKTLTLLDSKLPSTMGRIQNSVCVIGTKVYIIGVRSANHLIDTRLYVFDPITKTTKVITDASTFAQGENVSVAAIGNKIYAFGGYTHADGYLTSISEYTINGEQITRKVLDAKLPYGMINMTTGVLNGRVYLFGGDNGDNVFFRDILIFDPIADAVYIRSGSSTANTLTLGTAHSNAFYGDLGYKAYKHSQATGNPHNTQITDITGLKAKVDAIDSKMNPVASNGLSSYVLLSASNSTKGVMTIAFPEDFTKINVNGTDYAVPDDSIAISTGQVITVYVKAGLTPYCGTIPLTSTITLPCAWLQIWAFGTATTGDATPYAITIGQPASVTPLNILCGVSRTPFTIPIRNKNRNLVTNVPVDTYDCINLGYWQTNYKPFNYTTISTLSAVEHGFNVEYQIDGKSAEIEIPLEGTDDIIVDIDETNKMINIHLDAKVRAKLAKMLTLPAEAPAKNSIVGVGTNNAQMIMTEQEARDAISVYKTLSISQTDYDNLAVKDNKTLYLITG
nr:MAG TPA: Kelch repeat [Caudoviricetes sp.]